MEWERAKNYILIFFVLLNICLVFLLFLENRRYTMTREHERLIHRVLNQNNITMYHLPMRRSPPMRPLEVRGFCYDIDSLLEILFEEPDNVLRESRDGMQEFRDGTVEMSISNGFIFFRAEGGFGQYGQESFRALSLEPGDISVEQARVLTDEFIQAHFPDFREDDHFRAARGMRIVYRQVYRGSLVHSNFIEFLVTPAGIHEIEMQFGEIIRHAATPVMLFAPDEALLTFVQRVSHITRESPMHIASMDLVYFKEYVSDQPNLYHAVPFYRIFVLDQNRPFLINAFTNVIID